MTAVMAAGADSAPGPDRLFTYGTLMTGFSRRPLLGAALLEGRGRIRGSLYHFGDYPGLVLDDGGWVAGELYRVPDLPARLPALDREEWYDPADEAAEPLRAAHGAVHGRGSGVVREAWVYAYNERFGAAAGRGPRVESGDWRAHLTGARGTNTVAMLEDPR